MNVDAGGLAIGDDHPTRIMGVCNLSVKSPYAPSVFTDPGEAAAYVDGLVEEGADIVDIGLESANRDYEVLSPEEECRRLDDAVETIESTNSDPVFSVETRYHEVAAAGLDRGFDVVNDVCGFADPEMPRVCAEYDAAVVKMASPPDLGRPGAVEETPWAERKSPAWADRADYVDMIYEALKQNGFTDKTILDPAFGGWSDAKTLEDDRETFRRLREFRGHGRPLLVSINRKNFLRLLADRETEDALPVSLAATAMAVERGANVVRTHDVAETRDAVIVGDAFTRERLGVSDIGPAADTDATSGGPETPVEITELDVTTPGEAARHLERIGADTEVADETTMGVFEIRGPSSVRERLAGIVSDTNDGGDGSDGSDGSDVSDGSDGSDACDAWVTHGGSASVLVGTHASLRTLPSDEASVPDERLRILLERLTEAATYATLGNL